MSIYRQMMENLEATKEAMSKRAKKEDKFEQIARHLRLAHIEYERNLRKKMKTEPGGVMIDAEKKLAEFDKRLDILGGLANEAKTYKEAKDILPVLGSEDIVEEDELGNFAVELVAGGIGSLGGRLLGGLRSTLGRRAATGISDNVAKGAVDDIVKQADGLSTPEPDLDEMMKLIDRSAKNEQRLKERGLEIVTDSGVSEELLNKPPNRLFQPETFTYSPSKGEAIYDAHKKFRDIEKARKRQEKIIREYKRIDNGVKNPNLKDTFKDAADRLKQVSKELAKKQELRKKYTSDGKVIRLLNKTKDKK